MRSTRVGMASRFYACLRAHAFRVVEERQSHRLIPNRDAAGGESDPPPESFADELTIALICVKAPRTCDLFWVRLIETQDCEIRGGEHKQTFAESSIKVGRPLSNPFVVLMPSV